MAMTGMRVAAERVFTAAEAGLGLTWPAEQGGMVATIDAAARWLAARTPEREVAAVTSWPRVTSVSLVAPGTDPGRAGLALRFAEHLAHLRRGRPDLGGVFITAADRPMPPRGWVRLAHLVAFAAPDPVDELVWEILPRGRARRWLGRRPPRRCFVEAHQPGLVRLRQAARTGRLADTPAGDHLAAALHGRELSTEFVYRHTRLVVRALRVLAGARAARAPVVGASMVTGP